MGMINSYLNTPSGWMDCPALCYTQGTHCCGQGAAQVGGKRQCHHQRECVSVSLSHIALSRIDTPNPLQEGTTALHVACLRGHTPILLALVQHPGVLIDATDKPHAGGMTPLHKAAVSGSDACCRALLDHGIYPVVLCLHSAVLCTCVLQA